MQLMRGLVAIILSVASVAFAQAPSSSSRFKVERGIVYASPGGKELLLDAYIPNLSDGSAKVPGVLVVHGGSWKSGDRNQLAPYAIRLAMRGYAAFAINYRLAPLFKHPAQIEDCRSALRFMADNAERFHVDPDRLGAIGYSAGAHLVFLLGMAGDQQAPDQPAPPLKEGQTPLPKLKAVVAGGSPCNFTVLGDDDKALVHFLGGTKKEKPTEYVNASPHFYLSADDPPILFFHGTADELVTIKGPEMMVKELTDLGVHAELYRVDGGDHITAATNLKAIQHAMEFFDRFLKSP